MRSISTLTEAGNVNNQRAGIHHTLLSTSIENIINITPATTAQLGTIKMSILIFLIVTAELLV